MMVDISTALIMVFIGHSISRCRVCVLYPTNGSSIEMFREEGGVLPFS